MACLCNHSLREHEVTCFTNRRWCALVTGSLEGLLSLFCGPQIPEMHGISSYTIKFVLSELLCVCGFFYPAKDGHQVMFTHGEHVDVFDYHHLIVVFIEDGVIQHV